ncbi:MAG: hypothetical protein NTW11_01355 [Candidatus Staskawiczbacteria bacterium]|nr:hypothetical protein [Candidatus Staskawiczbacteria bacterium]
MKNMETMHNSNSEKIVAFENQQEIMGKIREDGFAEYAKTLPNMADAFDLEKNKASSELHRCICCMDGRTPCGIHSAGSGMLLSDAEFNKLFEESEADSISSHTGCGAAKIYAERNGLSGDPDEIAKQWAQEKAKELGVPYVHLEVDKPFHYERVCYYDGTGNFNYKGVKGLPPGFVVGRKFMEKGASLAEVGVAINIIFGDHGLGGLLNEENPFVLAVVADNQKEMEELKKELEEVVKTLGKKVTINGFISPKEEEETKISRIAA